MDPSVACSSDGKVGRAVGVCKVKGVSDSHRPVVIGRLLDTFELARLATQFVTVAFRCVCPRPECVRHEANPVNPITVVETIKLNHLSLVLELGA